MEERNWEDLIGEINNALQSITMAAELIIIKPAQFHEEIVRHAETIQEQVDRIAQLLKELF